MQNVPAGCVTTGMPQHYYNRQQQQQMIQHHVGGHSQMRPNGQYSQLAVGQTVRSQADGASPSEITSTYTYQAISSLYSF